MKRVIILGAAGRDFHDFNLFFRDNPDYRVVAFTASQIEGISGRRYPRQLAGRRYPLLAYSDLPYFHVMHKASLANSLGCDFWLMGPNTTMLKSRKPVIAVTAVRTGCGKSQTTRCICRALQDLGKKAVAVRHPMPYGDLRKQILQRYETHQDLDRYKCTIEEREEYEPLIDSTTLLFAGVDYEKILREAEKEADVIVFDGGNNDLPFFRPDLHIVLVDPHRPGHEIAYYPGETNLRMADLLIINKEKTAKKRDISLVKYNTRKYNPSAIIMDAHSKITASEPSLLKGKRALVVEDGPTLTHGGMSYGAGTIAARQFQCRIANPIPYLTGSLKKTYERYPHLGRILPAMGYSPKQLRELGSIINRVKCDVVIAGTPVDLRRVINVNKPIVRIRYDLEVISRPGLKEVIRKFLKL
jgi:predicted GTPase